MPILPAPVLRCTFYLYANEEDARSGERFGGTGFVVGVPSLVHPHRQHLYLVSNWHLVCKNGCTTVRINVQHQREPDIYCTDPADWEFLPGGGDVAVIEFDVDEDRHDIRCIPYSMFVPYAHYLLGTAEVGWDVFMIGRFIDHDGGATNQPAARFGNISVGPSVVKGMSNSGLGTKYYVLDMHSRSGFSGSPVFVYLTAGSNLIEYDEPQPLARPWIRLLGIHCGQFHEELKVEGAEGVRLFGASGMTSVLPAWRIEQLFNQPRLVARRAEVDERWKGQNPANEE